MTQDAAPLTGYDHRAQASADELAARVFAFLADPAEQRRLGLSAAWQHLAASVVQGAGLGRRGRSFAGVRQAAGRGLALGLDHLLGTRLTCPKCGGTMQWDWGWCPHHATPEQLVSEYDADGDHDGEVTRQEFLTFLRNNPSQGNRSLRDHLLTDVRSDDRLMVHYTEFRAVRGVPSLDDEG